jgi:hypothetical protein
VVIALPFIVGALALLGLSAFLLAADTASGVEHLTLNYSNALFLVASS